MSDARILPTPITRRKPRIFAVLFTLGRVRLALALCLGGAS